MIWADQVHIGDGCFKAILADVLFYTWVAIAQNPANSASQGISHLMN
jgi:hypothetical protein